MMYYFCGFPKTGTKTYYCAFKSTDLFPVHHKYRSEIIAPRLMHNFRYNLHPFDFFENVDVIVESQYTEKDWGVWPFLNMRYLEYIQNNAPECKLVLNTRDPHKILNSINNHNDFRKRLIRSDLPDLPPLAGREDRDIILWIEQHNKNVRENFDVIEIDIDEGKEAIENKLGVQFNWWGVARSKRFR